MSYLRYLCLFAYSGIQRILRCVFVCFSSFVPYVASFSRSGLYFLIAPSVFSSIYLHGMFWELEVVHDEQLNINFRSLLHIESNY
jgi:hypothetical protein